MQYEWDENKCAINLAKHGYSFEQAVDFAWDKATDEPDERNNYGESRIVSFAPLNGRIVAMLWTPRGKKARLIGLRKANDREVKRYERKT